MDRHTAKPGWNLTMWALAGFVLVALAVYVAGAKPGGDLVVTETTTTTS